MTLNTALTICPYIIFKPSINVSCNYIAVYLVIILHKYFSIKLGSIFRLSVIDTLTRLCSFQNNTSSVLLIPIFLKFTSKS